MQHCGCNCLVHWAQFWMIQHMGAACDQAIDYWVSYSQFPAFHVFILS